MTRKDDFQNVHLENALDYVHSFTSKKDPLETPYISPELATKGDNLIIQQLNLITALLVSLHKRLDTLTAGSSQPTTEFQQTLEKLTTDLSRITVDRPTKKERPDTSTILSWKKNGR